MRQPRGHSEGVVVSRDDDGGKVLSTQPHQPLVSCSLAVDSAHDHPEAVGHGWVER